MGDEATFIEQKKNRVTCEECRTTKSELFIHKHIKSDQGIVIPQTQGVVIDRGGLETYVVSLPRVLKSVGCPVDGCPVRVQKTGKTQVTIPVLELIGKV